MNKEVLMFWIGLLLGVVIMSFFWAVSITTNDKDISCEQQCKQLFYNDKDTFERLECIKVRCLNKD